MKPVYTIKKPYRTIELVLVVICSVIIILRWINVFNNSIVVINNEVTSHVSNFTLSLLAYLAVGKSWITSGVKFRSICILGLVLILINFIFETLLSFMNTVDIIDALYGVAGIVIGFIYFYYLYKYGLEKI